MYNRIVLNVLAIDRLFYSIFVLVYHDGVTQLKTMLYLTIFGIFVY